MGLKIWKALKEDLTSILDNQTGKDIKAFANAAKEGISNDVLTLRKKTADLLNKAGKAIEPIEPVVVEAEPVDILDKEAENYCAH